MEVEGRVVEKWMWRWIPPLVVPGDVGGEGNKGGEVKWLEFVKGGIWLKMKVVEEKGLVKWKYKNVVKEFW